MTIPLTLTMERERLTRNLGRELTHLASERDRLEEKRRDGNRAAVQRCREQIERKQANIEGYHEQFAKLGAA